MSETEEAVEWEEVHATYTHPKGGRKRGRKGRGKEEGREGGRKGRKED